MTKSVKNKFAWKYVWNTLLSPQVLFHITCVTWVTFSETFCVRSLILLGAMISISVGEGGLRRSEPKDIVTWGMRPMVRCRIKSESEVELKLLGFRSEKEISHLLVSFHHSSQKQLEKKKKNITGFDQNNIMPCDLHYHPVRICQLHCRLCHCLSMQWWKPVIIDVWVI